jgi:hypothetical protein
MAELQFDRAEPKEPPRAVVCAVCAGRATEIFYRVGIQHVCASCRDAVLAGGVGGSPVGRFFKALLFGAIGAAVGAIPYFLLLWLADMQVGLVAILVGYLAGIGVQKGSSGRGGWLYQLMAIGLAYTAIATTFIPLLIKEKDKAAQEDVAQAPARERPTESAQAVVGCISTVVVVAFAFVLPVIAPFASGGAGLMLWVFYAIAMYEAWKLNRRLVPVFSGPYPVGAAPPPSEPGRAS